MGPNWFPMRSKWLKVTNTVIQTNSWDNWDLSQTLSISRFINSIQIWTLFKLLALLPDLNVFICLICLLGFWERKTNQTSTTTIILDIQQLDWDLVRALCCAFPWNLQDLKSHKLLGQPLIMFFDLRSQAFSKLCLCYSIHFQSDCAKAALGFF